MGQEALKALTADDRFEVAGLLVRRPEQLSESSVPAYSDPNVLIEQTQPDVWLDFTDARSVVRHIDMAIAAGVRPVVGATGYTDTDVARWDELLRAAGLGGIAAPNFAVGALLMMRFAAEAARFFPNVEIIELHHDGKRDAPSGTARRTAQAIGAVLGAPAAGAVGAPSPPLQDEAGMAARGLDQAGIRIHSVRLPGLVAHQEVIFGGTGEVLTIRHDSLNRSSFMPGVLLACHKVMELTGLVYGLEHLLW
jgi:4-hydroxy-tetrahydrodipicolinate reductase